MRYRKLGKTEVEISEIGYGAWGIGGEQWRGNKDEESLRALRRAFELGVNFVDTALAYGDGHSEELVGRAVKSAPRRVFVATKVPPKNRIWPATPSTPICDVFPYDYIVESTNQSLQNLSIEQVCLQQLHVWTDAWVERDEWQRAAEELKRSGKIRYFGISVSEHDPDSALLAVKTGKIDAVQVIYNIFDQTPEASLFPLCQDRKVGVLARVPLDEGGLTGAITENTKFEPGDFRDFYFRGDRKRQVVERVQALKKDLAGMPDTLPQIALRFCLSHPVVSTVIPGMRRLATVESSCRASGVGPLDANTLAMLKQHTWDRNFYE
ncbi:MAG: aldo/keto reductase [Acidobacteriaceae bacterium]|nr:aldo/keto reductase [Acidobacteriaceae bacterium]MBV9781150.1 aldo/keto reductase [Acidobacteriaceae bacterium]